MSVGVLIMTRYTTLRTTTMQLTTGLPGLPETGKLSPMNVGNGEPPVM